MSNPPDWVDPYGCMGIWDDRTDGPVHKEYDSHSKTFTFIWWYKGKKVMPFPGSLASGKVIKGKLTDETVVSLIVLNRIEDLIFEVLYGDHKIFAMEKQKRYIELIKRKEQE